MEFINSILPVVYAVVGVVLVWFVVELAITVRRARTVVEDVKKQAEPTLASAQRITADLEPVVKSVQKMTESLEPAVDRVDPLVERVSLTVDAANLEIMRLDGILEDVSEITGSASSAVSAVEAVTSAPLATVNAMTDRVRGAFRKSRASDESIELGQLKSSSEGVAENPAAALVSESVDAVVRYAERKAADFEEKRNEARADATAEPETTEDASTSEGSFDARGKHARVAKRQDAQYYTYGDGR